MAAEMTSLKRPGLVVPLEEVSNWARDFARAAKARNTQRAYTAAWSDFQTWCDAVQLQALPASPSTVGLFLSARASTHKAASLSMRLVAIRQAHRLAGHRLDTQAPEIRETFQGIRRTIGTAPTKKAAVVLDVLRDAVSLLAKTEGLRALRDRALLLVGFAAALRRSELVALDVSDLTFTPEGAVLRLRRRKTDQEGKGSDIAIPLGLSERTCPVLALRAWLDAAGITEGAVLVSVNKSGRVSGRRLSDRDVARAVKAAVQAAGYDQASFSGHSLRSGFVTTAARNGVPENHIQNQTGHRSLPVLRGYIQRGSLFVDNAAAKVGL